MPVLKRRKNMPLCGASLSELTESHSFQAQKLQIHTERGLPVFHRVGELSEGRDSPRYTRRMTGIRKGREGRRGQGKARECGFERSNIK